MENFITWETLGEIATLAGIIFSVVEFTKELPIIRMIPTKYWSFLVGFMLILAFNLHANTFTYWDIVLYILSAITISLSANGLSNFNKK